MEKAYLFSVSIAAVIGLFVAMYASCELEGQKSQKYVYALCALHVLPAFLTIWKFILFS